MIFWLYFFLFFFLEVEGVSIRIKLTNFYHAKEAVCNVNTVLPELSSFKKLFYPQFKEIAAEARTILLIHLNKCFNEQRYT